MPKIRINEIDRTGRVQASSVSNVVFLPIRLNSDSGTQITKAQAGTLSNIALFRSAKDFKAAADATVRFNVYAEDGETVSGTKEVTIIDSKSMGYKLCVHLLNIGFEILVEALEDVSPNNVPSWDALKDRSLYDIRFLTLGAFVEGEEYTNNMLDTDVSCFNMTGQISSMLETAFKRGDCVALINANEKNPGFDYSVASVRGEAAFSTASDYGAAFTPWFYTKNSDFSSDGKEVKIPAAFGYLFAYANAIKNNPEWYAIAGFERGIIPELTGVCHAYSTSEVEVLQARSGAKDQSDNLIGEVGLDAAEDNIGIAINPICYVRPAGNIIYGNRTMHSNDSAKKLVASSFLNIRNGLSAIKKVMYEASRKYTFEQNTETLWINFQSYITPLLDRMQSGNGILGYTFIKQKTDAKARLKARLNLVPVEAVEDFDLEVYLTDDLTVSE